LRSGYDGGRDSFAAGIGFAFRRVRVDYAFLAALGPEPAHILSLSYGF
jgi:hypothetical protein